MTIRKFKLLIKVGQSYSLTLSNGESRQIEVLEVTDDGWVKGLERFLLGGEWGESESWFNLNQVILISGPCDVEDLDRSDRES